MAVPEVPSDPDKIPALESASERALRPGSRNFDLELVRQYRPLIREVVEDMRDQLPFETDLHEVMSVASVVLARSSERYADDTTDSFETYIRNCIREAIVEEFPSTPLAPPSSESSSRPSPQKDGPLDLSGCRILVVDDSPLTRRKLRFLLERQNFEVFEARSGEEALWLSPECHPDLILLDVMLDGMNGFETCRRLKQMPGLNEVPVIFLTGKTDTNDIVTGFQQGACDYIGKPFKPQEAMPRIRTHLNVRLLSDFRKKHIEELHTVNRAKDRLLRVASHDLRNPLSAIRGISEMLEEDSFGALNEEQREMVTSIRSATEGMMELITDLLEISTLESNQVRINFGKQSIVEVAQSVVNLSKVSGAKKSIDVRLFVERVPAVSVFDKNQIRRVIENLVSNAIKFSPLHTQVDVRLGMSGKDILVEVIDQGQGVPESEQSALFKEFSRTSVQPTAGEQSTGLGLSICRKIIDGHGGEIAMCNRSSGGARFFFTLPLEQRASTGSAGFDAVSGVRSGVSMR